MKKCKLCKPWIIQIFGQNVKMNVLINVAGKIAGAGDLFLDRSPLSEEIYLIVFSSGKDYVPAVLQHTIPV